jgi:hypothetical protein
MSIPNKNNFVPDEIKTRFKRGRKPGKPLSEYEERTNPNDRPGLKRFSVSMPVAMGIAVEQISAHIDSDFSKMFRKSMDLYVDFLFNTGAIDKTLHTRYWTARRPFNNNDMTGDS